MPHTAKETKNSHAQLILPFAEVAAVVRQKIQGMDDETLVRTVVAAGLVEGLPMPGLVKAKAEPAPANGIGEQEVEDMILAFLKSIGRGASSTEIAEHVACDNKERVVRVIKTMAERPSTHAKKIYRAGPHKFTRYAVTKSHAKAASTRARHAA